MSEKGEDFELWNFLIPFEPFWKDTMINSRMKDEKGRSKWY